MQYIQAAVASFNIIRNSLSTDQSASWLCKAWSADSFVKLNKTQSKLNN